jgi:SAM-dependent methyltransferase
MTMFYQQNLVTPSTHTPLVLQNGNLVSEKTFPLVHGVPCFLPRTALTEHQQSELNFARDYIRDVLAGQNPKFNPQRPWAQSEECWNWTTPWLNPQTITPDTRIVSLGGSFVDDLPHIHSNYKFNIDHLAHEYLQIHPGLAQANTHYIAAAAEALPFADSYADIVYTRNSLDHVCNPLQTLCEIHRILKPAGKLLVGVYYNSTILEDHESTVVDDEFLARCISPLFQIDFQNFRPVPPMLTIEGTRTSFMHMVCTKRPDVPTPFTAQQIESVRAILEHFHAGTFLQRQGKLPESVAQFAKLAPIPPYFATDIWRILYASLQVLASQGKENFLPLARALLGPNPTTPWLKIIRATIKRHNLGIDESNLISDHPIDTHLAALSPNPLLPPSRWSLYLALATQAAHRPTDTTSALRTAIDSLND